MRVATILRRLTLWTVVCTVCAAPSWFWAVGSAAYDPRAMVLGVVCFVLLLTAITCTERFERLRRRPFVRRTLYIGYGTRIVISVAIPVGAFVDLWPGMVSIEAVRTVGIEPETFTGTLLTTLLQGTFLNCIVLVFMLVVFPIVCAASRKPRPQHLCAQCGYDTRGNVTSLICPECGTPLATTVEERQAAVRDLARQGRGKRRRRQADAPVATAHQRAT